MTTQCNFSKLLEISTRIIKVNFLAYLKPWDHYTCRSRLADLDGNTSFVTKQYPKTVLATAKTVLAVAKTVLVAAKIVLAAAKTILAAVKTVWRPPRAF